MENLIADLRYAARTLVKTPAFLLISVLTLALGIGGNIAIFTLVQAVLLQPLPFPQPERLVRIFDNRGEPGTILTRRFGEAASLRLTRGSSWIWKSRKRRSQRRFSPTGFFSPAEDALKRRVT